MQFSTQNPERIAPRISPVSHFFCFSAYFWGVFWNFCCFAWRGEPSLGQARRGEPSRVVARGPRPMRCNRPNCLLLAGPAMGCCPHRGQSREEAASQPEGAVPGYPHCIPSRVLAASPFVTVGADLMAQVLPDAERRARGPVVLDPRGLMAMACLATLDPRDNCGQASLRLSVARARKCLRGKPSPVACNVTQCSDVM